MVPKLRFPLFHSQWDAVSLGDIIKIKSGQGFKAEEYSKSQNINKVRLLQIENVGYGTTKWTDNVKYLPDDYLSSYKEFTLEKGDVVLALNRPVTNNQLKITTLKSEDVPSILYQRVGKFIFLEKGICEQFYYQMFQEKIKNFVLVNSIGSDQPFISLTTLYRHEVYSTKLCEQTKIADFLSSADEKIKLLDKQYDLLCQYKKGMMQKIFSQEVRFKDENGKDFPEWKQKKIREITSLIKDGTHGTHNNVTESDFFLLSAKNIQEGKVAIDKNDRKISEIEFRSIFKNYDLEPGDILLSVVGTIGRVAIYSEQYSNYAFQRSVAFFRFPQEIPEFIYQLFNATKFQKELLIRQVISAQPGIYLGDLADISLEIPVQKEQMKIANFLSALDDKIAVTKAELDMLKTWKQGLLQQMFV
ncbi:restriction endonuclease subunit S [Enterobacter kobei]|uniref:restriction endonuclease subunit S n=1 Tax=Enterobacter kobei TaxID=208224 RepID=UPI003F4373C7